MPQKWRLLALSQRFRERTTSSPGLARFRSTGSFLLVTFTGPNAIATLENSWRATSQARDVSLSSA